MEERAASTGDEPAAADAALAELGMQLAASVAAAVPGWVVRCVEQRAGERSDGALLAAARRAGDLAAADVGPRLRQLLAADVDEQWTNPIAVLRQAVEHPTAVLRDAGVPPVPRDDDDRARFPDDDYDLTPRTFADIDPALADLGLAWGAAKAHAHLRRHRPGGTA